MSTNLSNVTNQLAKTNTAFSLVNQNPGQLFIGEQLTLTKEVEQKKSTDQVLDDVIIFLSQKNLHSEQSLSTKLLLTFRENLNLFVKDETSSEIQEKMRKIRGVLADLQQPFHAKLNRILNKEVSSIDKHEVDFLHRTLSYLAFEFPLLQQVWNVLAIARQNEKLMAEALDKGVCFSPASPILPDHHPEWSVSVSNSITFKDKYFNLNFNRFLKLFNSKNENKSSFDYFNLLKCVVDYKGKCSEEEATFIDMILVARKLQVIFPVENKFQVDFCKYFLPFFNSISNKQTPIYESSLDELNTHCAQVSILITEYYQMTVEVVNSLVRQMPKDNPPALYKSIIESEGKITSEYFDKLEVILMDYLKCFEQKVVLYDNCFKTLISCRSSIGIKSNLVKFHTSLFNNLNKRLFSFEMEFLPTPQAFKTRVIVPPLPFKFAEDRVVEEMQMAQTENVSTAKVKKKKKKNATTHKNPIQFLDIQKIPRDIAMRIFFFMGAKDILNFGETNHLFHEYTQHLLTNFPYLYRARLDFVNLDSARQSKTEVKRSERGDPSLSGKGDEENRFGEVAASPNSQNLSGRGIVSPTPASLLEQQISSIFMMSGSAKGDQNHVLSEESPDPVGASVDVIEDAKERAPSLPRRSETPEWYTNLKSLLDGSSSARVVKKINADRLGKSLADPAAAFESVFKQVLPFDGVQEFRLKNSALQKLIGWIIFTQKMLELSHSSEIVGIIQKFSLGKILSQCAELLHYVPQDMITHDLISRIAKELIFSVTQVLETLSHHYFFESSEWKDGLKNPRSANASDFPHPALFTVLETILEEKSSIRSFVCVAAWDNAKNRLMVAKSGRTWAVNPAEINEWENARKKCSFTFSKESVFFSWLTMGEMTMRFIFNTVCVFSQFCKVNQDTIVCPESIANYNKIRGDFVHMLGTLHSTRSKVNDRILILSVVKRFFSNALSNKKWDELFDHFQEDQVTENSLMRIVAGKESTKKQALMMALCYLPCGEVKIALDCCRELGTFSPKQLQSLPKTLGERLLFSAFQPVEDYDEKVRAQLKSHQLPGMDICQKCKDLWPVFEALYWSIRECGLDMSVIEKLSQKVGSHEITSSFDRNSLP